jgi:siroheme synthase
VFPGCTSVACDCSVATNPRLCVPEGFTAAPSVFTAAPQTEIHELLLQFAEAGATVVRLKGGDPYVFGR